MNSKVPAKILFRVGIQFFWGVIGGVGISAYKPRSSSFFNFLLKLGLAVVSLQARGLKDFGPSTRTYHDDARVFRWYVHIYIFSSFAQGSNIDPNIL